MSSDQPNPYKDAVKSFVEELGYETHTYQYNYLSTNRIAFVLRNVKAIFHFGNPPEEWEVCIFHATAERQNHDGFNHDFMNVTIIDLRDPDSFERIKEVIDESEKCENFHPSWENQHEYERIQRNS